MGLLSWTYELVKQYTKIPETLPQRILIKYLLITLSLDKGGIYH